MKRETLQQIMNGLLHTFSRPTFYGLENLPTQDGVIVATNHMSLIDTLMLFINPVRKDMTALVADKYQKYVFFRWILDTGGVIWLDRENADFGALRAAVDVLRQGMALGIAPEGTRSVTGQLLEGKPGAVLVALRAKAPIVPVGIAGTEVFFSHALTLRRPKITVRFGKPFRLEPLARENREEQMARYTTEVMCHIAALLPEKYHGFYRGNPRLQELLRES